VAAVIVKVFVHRDRPVTLIVKVRTVNAKLNAPRALRVMSSARRITANQNQRRLEKNNRIFCPFLAIEKRDARELASRFSVDRVARPILFQENEA
jgi:hypothetical protein